MYYNFDARKAAGNYQQDVCPSVAYIVIASYILLEMIVQRISDHYKNPVPSYMITTTLCAAIGAFMYFFEPLGENYQGITYIPPEDVLALFMPVYATSLIYQMDIFLFTKTLKQVCIIFTIGLLFTSTFTCILIYYVIHPEWEFYESLLATWTYMPVQPLQLVALFRGLPKYKNVATILEAESVGTFVFIYNIYQYFRAVHLGHVYLWYQHVMFLMRKLLGGFIIGAIMGKCTATLMIPLYNEPLGALSYFTGAIYLTYSFAEYFLCVSGNAAIVIMASTMVGERHKFATRVDENIINFISALQSVVEIVVLGLYITESMPHVLTYFSASSIYSSLIIYFSITFIRTCIFVACVFIFKKKQIDIDYDTRTALVLGLSGLKGSFNLIMAFILLVEPATFAIGRSIVTEVMFLYFYTMFANCTPMRLILRLIGFTTMSTIGRANMAYCMNFIMETRATVIAILKMDKYMADVNWEVVRKETAIPASFLDQGDDDLNADDDEIQQFETNTAVCPDCLKEIPYDLTEKEIEELCMEARSKILKGKKISIIRQFETGAINKNCLQVLLHNIDLILDAKVAHTKFDIASYLRPHPVLMFIRQFLAKRLENKNVAPPNNICGRFCFYLTNHIAYDYALIILIIIYFIFIGYYFLTPIDRFLWIFHVIGLSIFTLDYILKIFATYPVALFFQSKCSTCNLVCCLFETILVIPIFFVDDLILKYLSITLRILAFARVIYMMTLMKSIFPHLLDVIDRKIDMKITFGFDIAAALEVCCNEIIETLEQIVDFKLVRDIYAKDLKHEKNLLTKQLQLVQKERPWIPITMKTKQVIRTTLNTMNECLIEMKNSGYLDNIEFNFLEKEVAEKIKILRSIQIIRPPPPKIIFKGVPWLIDQQQIIDYLYSKVETVYFDTGEVVIKEGQTSPGVYIIVSGFLKLFYKPTHTHKELHQKYGALPVIDYLETVDFGKDYEDDIIMGSTIGERAFLSRRKYDCSIIADSPTQAYLLSHDILMDAFALFANPVTGLEAKMWKCSSINLAISIMTSAPLYQTLSQQEIKFKVDRAFVPNLRCYKMFAITEEMDDVLLIEGIAVDYSTSTKFHAPMLIPKNVQKLFLSKSSLVNVDIIMDTKLMIIPFPDVNIIDVMLNEEEQAEIVAYTTSKCILHNAQELLDKKPKEVVEVADLGILTHPSFVYEGFERNEDLKIIQLDNDEESLPEKSKLNELDHESKNSSNAPTKVHKKKYLVKKHYVHLSKKK